MTKHERFQHQKRSYATKRLISPSYCSLWRPLSIQLHVGLAYLCDIDDLFSRCLHYFGWSPLFNYIYMTTKCPCYIF